MITDEMLCTAAARSSAVYVRFLEQDFDQEHQHEFSQRFEIKIKRMCRQANHPILYQSIQRIASVFLALLIGGIVWLSVDIDARATFFVWVKEFYETYIVYRFESNSQHNGFAESYRPSWLPKGYDEIGSDYSGNTAEIRYMDTKGQGLVFSYSIGSNNFDWFVDTSTATVKQVYVNGFPADLLLSENPETANTIVWTTSDNTAFYISAFLSEADMIRVAESVQKNK